MISIRTSSLYILCLLALYQFQGCRSTPPAVLNSTVESMETASMASADNTILIFFIRNASFAGGGRTHYLKIDHKTIGQLTADNYYRLEMWPGEYHFSVFMPREEFFGQVSDPANVSRQIRLKPHARGNAYLCSYTDGMGSSGFSLDPITGSTDALHLRSMADNLKASDTAQVIELFGARYDGPAIHGRSHGEGTLSWPDGSVYRGTFEHGVPTRKALFYFPNGHIFMGPNHKGRPGSSGILMGTTGDILFSGRFVDELPHGTGLRNGIGGPEFCFYDQGMDITKTFRQRAKERLDIEDQQHIDDYFNRVEQISDEIEYLKKRLINIASRHDPDGVEHVIAKTRKKINALEKKKRHTVSNLAAQNESYIEQLRDTRYIREIAKTKQLRKSHNDRIEKELQWCRDEFDQGRNLCTCAPLADNFQQWQECWEPLRKRYIE